MSLSLTPELQKHLGLMSLHLKQRADKDTAGPKETAAVSEKTVEQPSHVSSPSMPKPELEKNEFRLLVKILQAIGHECVFNNISYSGDAVCYAHPMKNLVFGDINLQDDPQTMNLSSLEDMNQDTVLKRAVWEKLKTLS